MSPVASYNATTGNVYLNDSSTAVWNTFSHLVELRRCGDRLSSRRRSIVSGNNALWGSNALWGVQRALGIERSLGQQRVVGK